MAAFTNDDLFIWGSLALFGAPSCALFYSGSPLAAITGTLWVAGSALAIPEIRQEAMRVLPDTVRARFPAPIQRLLATDSESVPAQDQTDPFALPAPAPNATAEKDTVEATPQIRALAAALTRLPKHVPLSKALLTANPLAVTLGIDDLGHVQHLNFAQTFHVGLFGMTNAGKDNLLRVWFTTLTQRNSPDDVQFAVLDGKGDWLTPHCKHLTHMFFPPAGGYGAEGDQAMLDGITRIDQEAQRRQQLFTQAGVTSRDEYIAATNTQLPMLVVILSDVMTTVEGKIEYILTHLVSKARSLGIRVVVSMQTPSGKSTAWRANLGMYLTGALQLGSQDAPALGLHPNDLRFRPSQLPTDHPGVFIVRSGQQQLLIQSPYLPIDRFNALARNLPQRTAIMSANDRTLLQSLLVPAGTGSATQTGAHAGAGTGSGTGSDLVPADTAAEYHPKNGTGTETAGTGTTVNARTSAEPIEAIIAALVQAGWSANRIYNHVGGNRGSVLDIIRQLKHTEGDER